MTPKPSSVAEQTVQCSSIQLAPNSITSATMIPHYQDVLSALHAITATVLRRPQNIDPMVLIFVIFTMPGFLNIRFPDQPFSSSSGSQIHKQQIQQQIVKAQRNGMPAQRLNQDGDYELTCPLTLASAASIQHVGATVLATGPAFRMHMAQTSRSSGPFIQLPGFPATSAPSLRSQTVGLHPPNLGLTPGYNLNHIGYQATRTKMASNAYAGNGGQIILVEVRIVCLPEGKVKPILIGVSSLSFFTSIVTCVDPWIIYRTCLLSFPTSPFILVL